MEYAVGDRVYYRALVNNPGHYKPDDLLPGTIIHAFKNGEALSYRVRLDMRWGECYENYSGSKMKSARCAQIIIGHVRDCDLKRCESDHPEIIRHKHKRETKVIMIKSAKFAFV